MRQRNAEPPGTIWSPWQHFYGAVLALRRRWTRRHVLPRPVISIGNLHWGGSGKTPMTAAIAAHLRDLGASVAILSRGYGGSGRGVRMVSKGDGPLLGPRVAGDEPVELAGAVRGVAVLAAPDRFQAGMQAMVRLDPAPDVFLLDDGFQHVRLARDLDLVVMPMTDPFGGGRLAPSGRLREPLTTLRHADAVIVTGASRPEGAPVLKALPKFGFRGEGFSSATVARPPRWTTGTPVEAGTRMLLVSAIARPGNFEAAAERAGIQVAGHLKYRDHHRYPAQSLAEIVAAIAEHRAVGALATSKDAVKLLGRLHSRLAELPIAAEPEAEFWGWLEANYRRIASPHRDLGENPTR